ncbi:hypothetical protein OAS39_05115 [Pirellulales bacterium]|nr:hypothetical protein [Pirellulales bacterium]
MESGDPFQLIDVLIRHNVPLIIIGGHAVTYHGHVRATEDTDVVFRRTAESETALHTALVELNAHWIGDQIDPDTGIEQTFPVSEEYIRANRLMMMITDYGFLDVFDYIPGFPGEDLDELFSSSVEAGGRRFASLDWLRRMKQAAGRLKDQLDLENLPGD